MLNYLLDHYQKKQHRWIFGNISGNLDLISKNVKYYILDWKILKLNIN